MKRDLGPIKLELIHDTKTSFYRFFYRRNRLNDDVYEIVVGGVVMNKLNLQDKIFNTENEFVNYLDNITDNTTNVSVTDIATIKNELINFLETTNSCVEIILPLKEDNTYSENDIENIYNVAVETLGI